MQSKATTVEEYLNELPEDRIAAMLQLQKIIKKNKPFGKRFRLFKKDFTDSDLL